MKTVKNNRSAQSDGHPSKRAFGAHIESLVKRYLERRDLNFLCANYTRRSGEIDLVFEDESGLIVFVEVRFRRHRQFGGALASVDANKRARLRRTALQFLKQYRLTHRSARIDVVAVTPHSAYAPSMPQASLEHYDVTALPELSDLHLEWITNAIEG